MNTNNINIGIIGGGIYGLYTAKILQNKYNITIFDDPDIPKASIINQARVHNGYHYPRSSETAKLEIKYYNKFAKEFDDCIIKDFKQIYSIANSDLSKTNSNNYELFMKSHNLSYKATNVFDNNNHKLKKSWVVDELAIDTHKMMNKMLSYLSKDVNYVSSRVIDINKINNKWEIYDNNNKYYIFDVIINCTYGNINFIENLANIKELTPIKCELCEVILFNWNELYKNKLQNLSLTIMDGPFSSFMPYDLSGKFSLTHVQHTPHNYSDYSIDLRYLDNKYNINIKSNVKKLVDSMSYYSGLDLKHMIKNIESKYVIKAVPKFAESDDNRLFKLLEKDNNFFTVLSSKLSTIYEMDKLKNILDNRFSINQISIFDLLKEGVS